MASQAEVVCPPGGTTCELKFDATAGEFNAVTVQRVANDPQGNQVIEIRDADGTQVDPEQPVIGPAITMFFGVGCQRKNLLDDHELRCTAYDQDPTDDTDGGVFTKFVANLGDNADFLSARVGTLPLPPAELHGQAGDDFIRGFAGDDVMTGDDGDDELFGNAGNDSLDGGAGTDDELSGGAGTDTVTYASRTAGVHISLDGISNDGAGCATVANCEQDNVTDDVENAIGGSADDVIVGSAAINNLQGAGGNDRITGLGGGDSIIGGEGNNTLFGDDALSAADFVGAGDDTITGGAGNDTASGGAGIDTITIGDGANTADGGAGNDTITTLGGNDAITGGTGNDTINAGAGGDSAKPQSTEGNAGQDSITTGTGNDAIFGGDKTGLSAGDEADTVNDAGGDNTVFGGPGNDNLTTGGGKDTVNGEDGVDTVVSGNGDDTVDGAAGNDSLTLGGGNDKGYGRTGEDTIKGEAGDDQLLGADDDDTSTDRDVLDGGSENDLLRGYGGGDDLAGGTGSDTVSYEEKTAPVYAFAGSGSFGTYCGDFSGQGTCEGDKISAVENYIGGSEGDHFFGADPADAAAKAADTPNKLEGRGGNDVLEGYAGGDNLIGEKGDDDLIGGLGGDELNGGDGYDRVSYADRGADVNASLDGVKNDGEAGENDNVYANIERLAGGRGNDTLTGSDQQNDLFGNEGNDALDGKAGPDLLSGGDGTDTISYASRNTGVNISTDGLANDGNATDEGPVQDLSIKRDNVGADIENITGSGGNDTITASEVNNVILGIAGNDVIDAGLGTDDVQGGEGVDTAVYSGRQGIVDVTLDDAQNDGQVTDGLVTENDNIHIDIENLRGGDEVNVFLGSQFDNTLEGGGGNDDVDGAAGNDSVDGGAGNDKLQGGAGTDRIRPGGGQDTVSGGAGQDTADYSERAPTAGVVVTFDNVANDGEPGENDNVASNTERADLPLAPAVNPNPDPDPTPEPTPSPDPGTGGAGGAGGSGTGTDPGTSPRGSETTTQQQTSSQNTTQSQTAAGGSAPRTTAPATTVAPKPRLQLRLGTPKTTKGKTRVSVSGKMVGGCMAGKTITVRVLSGKKVVGSKALKLNSTCTFKVSITLKKRTARRLTVSALLPRG